ncbi:MAG: transporter [Deltaproteobacteria bacterium]
MPTARVISDVDSSVGSAQIADVEPPAPRDESIQPTFFEEPTDSPEPPDRPLGSAWFGGDRGPKVFAPAAADAGKEPPTWPDISEPGPDMGDFPNSAATLPKGRAYAEFSPVTLINASRHSPPAYFTQYLLRYGLTDAVEFRVFGNGITSVGGPRPTTGFSPLNLDLKIHLWDDRKEWLIPAMSFEAYLQTTWGSSQFTSGYQPSLGLNFDLPITKKINLEWTLSYHGVQQAININTREIFIPGLNFLIPGIHRTINRNFNQFAAQWAIEYEVNDQLELFFHGFHNQAFLSNIGRGEMIGVGGFWKFNSRFKAFGSINTGLSPSLPSVAAQLGLAVAL